MVEARICRKVIKGTGSAGFRVGGSVNETAYAGGVKGAATHRAGFEGRVEGTAGEAPGTELAGGAPEGEELGVGGRVFRRLAFVVGDRQDLLPPSDHGADGDLAELGGSRGLLECAPHHREVCCRVRCGSRIRSVPLRIFGFRLPTVFHLFVHVDDDNNVAWYIQRAASTYTSPASRRSCRGHRLSRRERPAGPRAIRLSPHRSRGPAQPPPGRASPEPSGCRTPTKPRSPPRAAPLGPPPSSSLRPSSHCLTPARARHKNSQEIPHSKKKARNKNKTPYHPRPCSERRGQPWRTGSLPAT